MEAILQWVTQVPPALMHTLGYGVLVLLTICESIPPLGMVIPGQTIVIAAGFLSSRSVLFYPFVFCCASLGMWIGEIVSYYLGKRYGHHFLKKYGKYVLISDGVLESVQNVIHKNWRWGLVLSEFHGWTRGLFPFMTGVARIPFGKFLLWSLLGAVLWGVVFTTVGYFMGESYALIAKNMGKFITRGIFSGVAIAVLFRYFRNADIPLKKGFSLMVLGDVVALLLFSLIAQRIYVNKLSFVWVDTWFQELLVHSPFIDTMILWMDSVFNMWFIGGVGLIILVYLYRKRFFYYFTVFVSSMFCTLFLFPLLKMVIQRARPPAMLVTLHDFSFPSGHAMVSIVFCLLCWYVFQRQIRKEWIKYSFFFLMVGCAVLIGMGRLFLHLHWFTDVLAGFLLGFSLLTTNILVWKVIFRGHLEWQKVVKRNSKKQLIDILL